MNHIALEASAGSGKTFTLSVRFIALILQGAKINDIVALTFTKKAVNEMKERISDVFLSLESKNAELAELEKILKISKDELIKRKNALRASFLEEELRIYTFDSFFSKILRLFATYEGLSVNYEQTEQMDNLDEFYSMLSEDEALDLVKNLKSLNISVDDFLAHLKQLALNYTGNYEINEVKSVDLMAVFKQVKAVLLSGANSHIKKWLDLIIDENSLLESSLLKDNASIQKAKESSQEFSQAYELLCSSVAAHYAYLESLQIKLCFKYLDKFMQASKQKQQKENLLSFSDVALYVHKILQNKELKDLFYFRLNSGLNHLLIDEFQDTSIIQYEIIKPIVEEIVSGLGINDKEKSFFYVGDKKQSIYTFRGAKQEVFDLFHQNKNYNIKLISLDTNYRSQQAIVDFVNHNFKNIYPQGVYKNQLAFSQESGKVSKIECDDAYAAMYKKIASLLKTGVKPSDICVLTRDNQTALKAANFLNEKNLIVSTNNSLFLKDIPSVRVLIEFAKFCIFQEKPYQYFTKCVLGKDYEPIRIDITQNPALIYRQIIKHLNIAKDEFILEFLHSVSKAKTFLSTLYEELSTQSSQSGETGINIMTIHKSKGLQFKHVISLEIAKNKEPNDLGLKIEYDFANARWYGFILQKKDIKNLRLKYDKNYAKKLLNYENAKELDKINTYYVAYTRAICSLCIIKTEKNTLEGLDYENLASENLDDALIDYVHSYEQVSKKVKTSYIFKDNIPLQNVRSKQFSSDAIILGNAFHYFCELSDFSQQSYEKCLKITTNKFSQVDKNKLENLCQGLINFSPFQELISNSKLIKEYNFMQNLEIFRIDLLAISENSIKIIDYKSSFFNKSYAKQLENYENFIKKTFKNYEISSYVIYYENDSFAIKKFNFPK